MTKRMLLVLCLAVGAGISAHLALAQDEERTVSFAEGAWDPAEWTPLRLPMQPEPLTFVQRPGSLGTTSFTPEQTRQGLDNVILMTDTGTDEGEFEVTFRIGPEKGTAPGMLLSPRLDGDVLETGIAVFVADYTMAVWLVSTNAETRVTEYEHLVRLARWQDPAVEHVLRCRWSKARRMVALQIDDSDVVILRFAAHEINSQIGIWGCHGTCDYYRLTMRPGGTLPWQGTPPE